MFSTILQSWTMPSNLLSRQGVHLGLRFPQILAQIVEMNQKTHLQKLSHDVLGLPIFWDKKSQQLRGKNQVWVVTVLLHIIKRLRTVESSIQMHHGHP